MSKSLVVALATLVAMAVLSAAKAADVAPILKVLRVGATYKVTGDTPFSLDAVGGQFRRDFIIEKIDGNRIEGSSEMYTKFHNTCGGTAPFSGEVREDGMLAMRRHHEVSWCGKSTYVIGLTPQGTLEGEVAGARIKMELLR